MTKKHKRKRGRPLGGSAPPEVRAYWRNLQREYRSTHTTLHQMKSATKKTIGVK